MRDEPEGRTLMATSRPEARVVGSVDLPHPTGTEQSSNLVDAEPPHRPAAPSRQQAATPGRRSAIRCPTPSGPTTTALSARRAYVGSAGFGEKRGALLRWLRGRFVIQLLDPLPAFRVHLWLPCAILGQQPLLATPED